MIDYSKYKLIPGNRIFGKPKSVIVQPITSVDKTGITFTYESGLTDIFNITSNTGWTINEIADWFDVDVTTGTGNTLITVTTLLNNTGVTNRAQQIEVTDGTNYLYIDILQGILGETQEYLDMYIGSDIYNGIYTDFLNPVITYTIKNN